MSVLDLTCARRRRATAKQFLKLMGIALAVTFLFASQCQARSDEFLRTNGPAGTPGGRLVVSLRAEPKTLNPVLAVDEFSRDVIRCLNADLIHINRVSLGVEPALAKSWKVSNDGRHYTLQLRGGLRFSDGHPVDADDVLFSFQVYLDEKMNSPQRDLLVIGGQPIRTEKLNATTVRFDLAQPYAAAERIFDSVMILPRHLLKSVYAEGKFSQSWPLTVPANELAGLGPFRMKEYVPGQKVVLERNPYYWKEDRNGNRLPYLRQVDFLVVPNQDAQVIRFQAGDTDVIDRISADNFEVLERDQKQRGLKVYDLGPGLEYNFLFFNLNKLGAKSAPTVTRKQAWFSDVRFRQAISAAIDRQGIARLVYKGRATALWGPVTPGNRLWFNAAIARPERSLAHARALLKTAGFSWRGNGSLIDAQGQPVEFTIIASSSNAERLKMAAIIQDDLKALGISVQVVPLEYRALVDRVFKTLDYDACVLRIASGDADPNSDMNVWASNGSTHLWNLGQSHPSTPWESRIDTLIAQQLITLKYETRKRIYDEVQKLVADNLPMIFLASGNILVGAKESVGNFRPAILDPYTIWNIDELYIKPSGKDARASGSRR